MPPSRLIEVLLETLSLAVHLEEQNPRNPITQAALQHSLQDLIAELQAIADTSSRKQDSK